jgi:hypothetical protein
MFMLIGILGNAFAAVGAESPAYMGATYYVSTTGSDTALGTQTAPFKTFARAVKALKPGDTLLVYPGTYYQGLAGIIPSGTDWTLPVTVKAMNPAQRPVLIPPAGASWPASDYVLFFSGYNAPIHHVIVDGFIMDGTNIALDVVKLEQGKVYPPAQQRIEKWPPSGPADYGFVRV